MPQYEKCAKGWYCLENLGTKKLFVDFKQPNGILNAFDSVQKHFLQPLRGSIDIFMVA